MLFVVAVAMALVMVALAAMLEFRSQLMSTRKESQERLEKITKLAEREHGLQEKLAKRQQLNQELAAKYEDALKMLPPLPNSWMVGELVKGATVSVMIRHPERGESFVGQVETHARGADQVIKALRGEAQKLADVLNTPRDRITLQTPEQVVTKALGPGARLPREDGDGMDGLNRDYEVLG